MSPIAIVIVVAICGVVAVAAAGGGLDRRARKRPTEQGSPHAMPLPRWMVGLVVVAAATGAIAAGAGIASSWGDDARRRSDELRSCSSSFSAELVTGPTVAALKALAEHGADSPEFRAAVKRGDPDRFIALARLSREDPSAFLAECHRSDG